MRKFILGFVIGVVLIPLLVYSYFASGSAPVATAAQAMPFEKSLARKALHARLQKEMPKSVPIPPDEAALTAGAAIYRENCAVCHGSPGVAENKISRGMFPYPPQLFHGHGVTDDPAEETYWKVANGIRMTGMPGFKETLTDTELWQVSLLLAHADQLPQAAKDKLGPAQPPPAEALPRTR